MKIKNLNFRFLIKKIFEIFAYKLFYLQVKVVFLEGALKRQKKVKCSEEIDSRLLVQHVKVNIL